jgi:hypothetical protein
MPLPIPPSLKKPVLSDSGLNVLSDSGLNHPSKELEFDNRSELATHSIDASTICPLFPPRYRKTHMSLENNTHGDARKMHVETNALTSFMRRISITGKEVTERLLAKVLSGGVSMDPPYEGST